MRTTLALAAVFAILCGAVSTAVAQVPPAQVIDLEEPDEVVPPPPPPPAPPPAPRPVAPVPPEELPTAVTVQCVAPPCPTRAAPVVARSLPQAPPPVDTNFRKIYRFGIGLDIMGPAYTLGLTAHWNLSPVFGLSATFGFVGPQVATLQARFMPVDGKWTPYVAGGVSFLLNPGWSGGSYEADCMAGPYDGYTCADSISSEKGDEFLFKGTNVVPSLEVGAMAVTRRGFSVQLGFTFYINGHYRDELGLLTVPWPKIGLTWYF